MRLACNCGRTYRAQDHDCPGCGATLRALPDDAPPRPVPPGAAGIDPDVLVRQKLALRDELRLRDRQLRQAEARLRELGVEIDRLRAAGNSVRRSATPLTLPSPRLDLSQLPLADEAPVLSNAIQLPDDRLPLFFEDPTS